MVSFLVGVGGGYSDSMHMNSVDSVFTSGIFQGIKKDIFYRIYFLNNIFLKKSILCVEEFHYVVCPSSLL